MAHIERQVLDLQVAHGAFGNRLHINQLAAPLHHDIADGDGAECGRKFRPAAHRKTRSQLARPGRVAEHIPDDGPLRGAHTDTLVGEVLATSGTRTAGLEADADLGAVKDAVVRIEVANPAGRFAAAGDTSMATQGEAVAHDDVLGGATNRLAILVAAALHGEVIISATHCRVLDQDIFTAGDIDTVATRNTDRLDLHATDNHLLAIDRCDVPEEALLELHPLQEDLLAVNRAEEGGKKDLSAIASVVDALLNGGIDIDFLDRKRNLSFFNRTAFRTNQTTLAREGDVLLVAGVDAGSERGNLDPLVGRKDGRQVVLDFSAEVEFTPLFEVEFHVALERDASRVPMARRDDDATTAPFCGLVNGLLNGACRHIAIGGAGDPYGVVGEGGAHHLGHIEGGLDGGNLRRTNRGSHLVTGRDVYLRGGDSCYKEQRKEGKDSFHVVE